VHRLGQGQVVEVAITDPRGQNKKPRPAVILTDTEELSVADKFVVAAITRKFSEPLPSDWILLPWSSDGRAKSGLREPSVVKCNWLRAVAREDIISVWGYLPATTMRDIMRIVSKL
jgi:mRNA-degrading endonuclease toxin of MazEF toxin-antitoxin module